MYASGDTAPGFEAVWEVFADCLSSAPGTGAAFCLYVDGRKVVDLAGGTVGGGAKPFTHETLQPVFSVTKGVSAMAALLLVQRGLLNPTAPVAEYWPDFAAAGKGNVTVAMVLGHRVGLAVCDRKLTREEALDGRSAAAALAAQQPHWTPGSAHGYHALTYGFLVGELVRRVDGRSLGQFVRDEVAPGLDLWIGLPAQELARVATLHPGALPPDEELLSALARFAPGGLPHRALTLDGVLEVAGRRFAYNDHDVLTAELPASNAVCSARALACLYSSTVVETEGRRLLRPGTVEQAISTVSRGEDLILGCETHFGLGFMLPTDQQPFLGPRSFGHPGAGGSLGMADPDLRIGLAFTTTGLGAHVLADPRALALVEATRNCVGR